MDFEEAERSYAEIRQQLDAGALSPEQFDERLEKLKVQAADGTWWAKGRELGAWYYHNGNAWILHSPPYRWKPTYEFDPHRDLSGDFQWVEGRVGAMKQQLDAGDLSAEEFDEEREAWKVQAADGTWWAKGRELGAWYYYDGNAWVRGVPPPLRGSTWVQDVPPGNAADGAEADGAPHRQPQMGCSTAVGLAMLIGFLVRYLLEGCGVT